MNISKVVRQGYENGAAGARVRITAFVLSNRAHLAIVTRDSIEANESNYRFQDGNMPAIETHDLRNYQAFLESHPGPIPPLGLSSEAVFQASLPVSNKGNKIRLHAFPNAEVVSSTFLENSPLISDWSARRSLLVYAMEDEISDSIVWFPLPLPSNQFQPHKFRISEVVNSISISLGGRVAVGYSIDNSNKLEGKVYVFDGSRSLIKTYIFKSQAVCVEFVGEESIVVGLYSGAVQVLNFKQKNIIALRIPSKKEYDPPTVCCFRVEGRKIYVSSLGNQENNLCCYNLDMVGLEPNVRYYGHRNLDSSVVFDVGGNILAAGDDNHVLRFWDKLKGGNPIGERVFQNETPTTVRFIGFEDNGAEDRKNTRATTGLWVVTDKNIYTYLV